eukprot:23571-Rhodomonas_salina.6
MRTLLRNRSTSAPSTRARQGASAAPAGTLSPVCAGHARKGTLTSLEGRLSLRVCCAGMSAVLTRTVASSCGR